MKNKSTLNWLSGFLIGGGIGAAVAVLTAPRSGEETRELLREKGNEMRDNVVQTYEDGRERVSEAAADARERASRVATDARERLSNLKVVGAGVAAEQKALIEKSAEQAKRAIEDKEPIPA